MNRTSGCEWAVTHDGRRMHVEHAKRLPRKTKKWVGLLFEGLGDRSTEVVVVSPR